MYDIPNLPTTEIKRWFKIRRIDRLLNWLTYDRYAVYENSVDSSYRLVHLIAMITDVLSAGMPTKDFKPYKQLLNELRNFVLSIGADPQKDKAIYYEAILLLKTILEHYREFIAAYSFS